MPSFPDSIFLFVLALLLFGPKRLPVLARELGKWVGEFRRASNEFKMQMEEELRLSEQAERNRQIAAIAAAAPAAPAIAPPEPPAAMKEALDFVESEGLQTVDAVSAPQPETELNGHTEAPSALEPGDPEAAGQPSTPLPIAVSGDLKIMPPSTGLPVAQHTGTSLAPEAAEPEAVPTPHQADDVQTADHATPTAETAFHGN